MLVITLTILAYVVLNVAAYAVAELTLTRLFGARAGLVLAAGLFTTGWAVTQAVESIGELVRGE